MMLREQDNTLSMIGGTLTTLAQQAGLMGQEIGEHNECVIPSSFKASGRADRRGVAGC